MKRFFNIAGPCIPSEHYTLTTLDRCPDISQLIESKQYFVIHAARQSGKTTLLNALEFDLNRDGKYVALYCSLESIQGITDPKEGIPAITRTIISHIKYHPILKQLILPELDLTDFNTVIIRLLSLVSESVKFPLVILFDEADCLFGQTLNLFLRQVRTGFNTRADTPFPASIAFVGLHDIRDNNKIIINSETDTLGSAPPFNIIAESLTLTNFTRNEIAMLYQQHTEEIGQIFENDAIDRASYWTCGQPWLVNALARECVEELLDRDYSKPVTAELIDIAAENLLCRRNTHIDYLMEKLKEDWVRRVVEPVILGKEMAMDHLSDDKQFCLDLGLLKESKGFLIPSNPIYAEVIIRTLSYSAQMEMQTMVEETPWVKEDQLDMNSLLKAFQQFWRENSEAYSRQVIQYTEAVPHLMLQAFLQRVINGGGQIVREFALGRMRLDLLVIYKTGRYPIEIKLKYQLKAIDPRKQLLAYMDRTGTKEGWLVIFDQDSSVIWEAKIRWETDTIQGKVVHSVWC